MGQVNLLDKGNMANLIYLELSKVIEVVLLEEKVEGVNRLGKVG